MTATKPSKAVSPVADKLREARALIERGWTQGVFARRSNGAATYAEDSKATCFCMVGVLYRVGMSSLGLRLLEKATRVRSLTFAAWNDHPKRTQAEVLAAFDKAIELATQEVSQ